MLAVAGVSASGISSQGSDVPFWKPPLEMNSVVGHVGDGVVGLGVEVEIEDVLVRDSGVLDGEDWKVLLDDVSLVEGELVAVVDLEVDVIATLEDVVVVDAEFRGRGSSEITATLDMLPKSTTDEVDEVSTIVNGVSDSDTAA